MKTLLFCIITLTTTRAIFANSFHDDKQALEWILHQLEMVQNTADDTLLVSIALMLAAWINEPTTAIELPAILLNSIYHSSACSAAARIAMYILHRRLVYLKARLDAIISAHSSASVTHDTYDTDMQSPAYP